MNFKPLFLLIILVQLSLYPLLAQNSFSAYPYFAYSGETKLMVGAFSFFRHELDAPVLDQEGRSFSILANTIYSQKKQFLFVIVPQYRSEDWKLSWTMELRDWPDSFYGIGNATDADDAEDFTARRIALESQITRDLGRDFELSLRLDQGWHKVRKSVDGALLQSSDIIGKEPSVYSGVGYGLADDSTDAANYPERGLKLEFRQLFYDDAFGSDFNYSESRYDLRAYFKNTSKSVLAVQSDLVSHNGDTPFYNYPELGKQLRAYDSKRFIDETRISQRLEQRVFPFEGKFSRRLGFVVFAETGQVAQQLQDIRFKDWHYSFGGGLRFSIVPSERLNLRADFGFGEDSVNFMVNAREVF